MKLKNKPDRMFPKISQVFFRQIIDSFTLYPDRSAARLVETADNV